MKSSSKNYETWAKCSLFPVSEALKTLQQPHVSSLPDLRPVFCSAFQKEKNVYIVASQIIHARDEENSKSTVCAAYKIVSFTLEVFKLRIPCCLLYLLFPFSSKVLIIS